jgi:putative ABC transport system permease protein
MRTRVITGRTFTETDNAAGRKMVVIDEILEKKAFPGGSAVGKRIVVLLARSQPEILEVIGVVAHQRLVSLSDLGREQIYVSDGYMGHGFVSRWAVRTAGTPAKYSNAIRQTITNISPAIVIADLQPMAALVARSQAKSRFSLLLVGTFAVISALMAMIGLYGVISTVVRERTVEIGLRVAVGASPSKIFKLVVGHGLRLAGAGVSIGFAAAICIVPAMASILTDVRPLDLPTFAVVIFVFLLTASVASWLPARRAAALDPIAALRDE